jgi:hypothetical protein
MGKLAYTGKMLGEFWRFAQTNKVYWIIPLVVVLGLIAILIVASQTVAPFIYTLF